MIASMIPLRSTIFEPKLSYTQEAKMRIVNHTLIRVAVLAALSVQSKASFAVDREYLTSQCNEAQGFGSDTWKYNKRTIFVYVESDMASEMNACGDVEINTSTTDTTITQSNLAYAIQSSLEVWNQESRGDYFVYAGALTTASGSPVEHRLLSMLPVGQHV